ncbi:cytochrome c maturation protein CcmE [Chengkuizengella sediminis]|uniref:cytochrome c maturation protein CcmE n=1 Tax=Chengkuizengella sediminis TaxID=1885917 RepID=UPI00138979BE|nr:cytochrome c maturation protein CcmE [Chengkuizengella sediminis]NDI33828.1 cytochrome c maturation protein CcmE [Chengkuizengella sediminis]
MKKNKKMLIGFSTVFVAILILLIGATTKTSGSELTLQEIIQEPHKFQERFIMTQGDLIEKSIQWNADLIELSFQIEDEFGNVLSVVHQGVKPDNFSEDVIVIVEGFVHDDGTFNAEKVQTKCPSKYEGEEYDPELHEKEME